MTKQLVYDFYYIVDESYFSLTLTVEAHSYSDYPLLKDFLM